MLKLGYVGQGSRSLGQIVENNIVHIRSIISFTPKLIALGQALRVLKFYIKVICRVFKSYNCQTR